MYYNSYYGQVPLTFDWTYLLIIAGMLITIIAQISVSSAYRRYSRIQTRSGVSSMDAARVILQRNGIYSVSIEASGGALSDHFDPRSMTIRLAADPAVMTSVAAVAVAAHECGHAIQHDKGYVPLKIRAALVPVVNLASRLALPLLLIGIIFELTMLAEAACVIFGAVVLFQLVTLPVELNASRRAVAALSDCCLISEDEMKGAKKVLRAAAFTYIAATLMSALQLLRFLALARRRR